MSKNSLRWFLSYAMGCSLILATTAVMAQSKVSDEKKSSWWTWRGENRDGKVTNQTWQERLNNANFKASWQVNLEPSYSGPIVTEDRVFTTETRDKKTEWVLALDRKTGKELWSTSWEGAISVPFFAKANGDWIRSTPAFDGKSLFVGGMRDRLVSLSSETGEILWQIDFVEQLKSKVPDFGFVCSPLIDGDFVYVQAGGAFCKIEKESGKIVWSCLKDGGGMFGSAFSSPIVATIAGKRQLVVQTRAKLAGVDPDTGTVLWEVAIPAFRGMNILTPTTFEEGLFTSAYGDKTYLFEVTQSNGQFSVTEKWNNKARGYMSSPVVIDRHVYMHLQNKRFCCIHLSSGETKWTSEPFGQYWSMVANGNRILALDETGILYLIQANPDKFELVDQIRVSNESTWAHLVVTGEEVFIRSLKDLTKYIWK